MIQFFDERVPAQIWERLTPIPDTGCWMWLGGATGDDYGAIYVEGKQILIHRYMYTQLVGPIPDGLHIDHRCEFHRCAHPIHTRPMSLIDNVMRGQSPCAQHARKTHCRYGHEFTPENTRVYPQPTSTSKKKRRVCLTCRTRASLARRGKSR